MGGLFFFLFVVARLILRTFCLSGKISQLYHAKSVNTTFLTPLAELRNMRHPTRCALSCYKHILCQSFDYSPSESRCLLNTKTVSTTAAENVHHNTTMIRYENYVAVKFGETCNAENKCNAPHGKCFLRPNSFICACEAGYSGQFCEIPPPCGFRSRLDNLQAFKNRHGHTCTATKCVFVTEGCPCTVAEGAEVEISATGCPDAATLCVVSNTVTTPIWIEVQGNPLMCTNGVLSITAEGAQTTIDDGSIIKCGNYLSAC